VAYEQATERLLLYRYFYLFFRMFKEITEKPRSGTFHPNGSGRDATRALRFLIPLLGFPGIRR
jgi:hypothetical protein